MVEKHLYLIVERRTDSFWCQSACGMYKKSALLQALPPEACQYYNRFFSRVLFVCLYADVTVSSVPSTIFDCLFSSFLLSPYFKRRGRGGWSEQVLIYQMLT
jgi:hypothetical protein